MPSSVCDGSSPECKEPKFGKVNEPSQRQILLLQLSTGIAKQNKVTFCVFASREIPKVVTSRGKFPPLRCGRSPVDITGGAKNGRIISFELCIILRLHSAMNLVIMP